MPHDWLRRLFSLPMKLMRLTAYFAFVSFVFLFFGARSVWGSAEQSLLDIGEGLTAMGDVLGPNYRVRLNGEPVNVASTTTDLAVGKVLDQFEQECSEHTGGLEEELTRLSESLKGDFPPNLKGAAGKGILRKELGGHGMIACFGRQGGGGAKGILAAAKEVLETGDLAPLGNLRYVTAERRTDGKTHVVTVWTEGRFRIGHMFPASGDAPGADPGLAVRPPAARRILSAGVDGSPFGVQVYDSAAAPEAVLDHYDREMPVQGWRSIEGATEVSEAAKTGRAYMRGAVDLIVSAEKSNDGHTVVSIVSMPPR
jgi:hypothetical protein